MRDVINVLRQNPPSPYIDAQFNRCPSAIAGFIDQFAQKSGTLLDFGCGPGIKALSMALTFPNRQIVGVDITKAFQQAGEFAERKLGMSSLPENLSYLQIEPGQPLASVATPDVIYSWSVIEHVDRRLLPGIVEDMYACLPRGGSVFVQIAPLYYSPFGSHLREYDNTPWVHLDLSHEQYRESVIKDRRGEASAGELRKREWMFGRFEALNKITARELRMYFQASGFKLAYEKLRMVDLKPPPHLACAFEEEALLNNELIFYFGK